MKNQISIGKYFIILSVIFYISWFYPYKLWSQEEKHFLAPVNADYIQWLSEKNAGTLITQTKDGYGLGYIPEVIKPDFGDYYSLQKIKSAKFPQIYDLRAIGYITPVKNQILNGPCWAFASIGAVESLWLKDGYGSYDLSEKNMVSCHGFDNTVCMGGNNSMAMAYLNRRDGPISESDDPYGTINCSSTCLTGFNPQAWVSDSRIIPGDSLSIKQAILDYGAIASSMYYSSTYYNASNYTYYYNGTSYTNHGVLIAGWDDTKITAGGTGAWIVKNSWGTGFGENGYFYVSYNDSKILSSNAAYPVRNNFEVNGQVYYYDKYGRVSGYGLGGNTAYGLVKFIASNRREISKIVTYASTANTELDINIYDSFDGTNLSILLGSITNQQCSLPGYYSFDLNNPILLSNGEDFYIRVKYQTPGYLYPIPIEAASAGYISNPVIESGKCWISSNGLSWTQIGNGTPDPYDLCIKAYGTDPGQAVADFSASSTLIQEGDSINFTDLTTGNPTSWSWSFPGGIPSSSSLQNPTDIAYNSPGNYDVTLTASNASGSHTLIRYNYINVLAYWGCDTITNFVSGDQSAYYYFTSSWGWPTGHNGYFMTQYADKYDNLNSYMLDGVFLKLFKADAGSASSFINIKIWNEDASGKPGNEIYTKQILIDSLFTSFLNYNYINFDSLVYVDSNYFVGFTLNYGTPQDSVGNYVALNRTINPFNTAYAYYNGSWWSFSDLFPWLDNTSFDLKVLRCPFNELPIANFTASNNNIAQGGVVNFTSTSSGYPGSYSWHFSGGSPQYSNNSNPAVLYGNPGIFGVSLVATNQNGSDSIYKSNYITVLPPGNNNIFGLLSYDNDQVPPTALNNNKIYLKTITNNTIDSTNTDLYGFYYFSNVPNGTYLIKAACTTSWGGGTTNDALLILQHFVGIAPLQGLPLKAAEVSGEGYINSMDAMNVQQRFLGTINSFTAGDWVPTSDTIQVLNNNVQVNIKTICFGDVNRSYIP